MNINNIINKKIHKVSEILNELKKYSLSDEIKSKIEYWNNIKCKLKEWKMRLKD